MFVVEFIAKHESALLFCLFSNNSKGERFFVFSLFNPSLKHVRSMMMMIQLCVCVCATMNWPDGVTNLSCAINFQSTAHGNKWNSVLRRSMVLASVIHHLPW